MADTLDVVTEAEAKAAVKYTSTSGAILTPLAQLITAVSRRLDDLCGPIVMRTCSNEAHHGGKLHVRLNNYPVSSITTVTEYDNTTARTLTAETNTAKTASNYYADLATGRLFRRASNYDDSFPCGRGNIVVTYIAGRYATTATVDARFKEAAGEILAHIWRSEQGFNAIDAGEFVVPVGFAIPNRALDLIADDLRGPNVGIHR